MGKQINQEQVKFLEDIFGVLGEKWKNIPIVNEIEHAKFGIKFKDGNIIGLGLNDIKLTTLPESIGTLKSLKNLSLMDNQLSTLPTSIGNLGSLIEIYLGGNQLTALPEAVWNLTSLELLGLGNNALTALPEAVGNLTSLEALNVANNQLTTLPESIGNLKSLSSFSLEFNKLTALPESIGNLSSLTYLYLNGNHLTTLPESMWNLKSLEILKLKDNPFNQEFLKMIRASNPSYEYEDGIFETDFLRNLLKTLEKKWLQKENERRIKIEKEVMIEDLRKGFPMIEKLIREMKFANAIGELNNIRKIAKKNSLDKIIDWTEKNLKLCNAHIIKKAVLELGIKFARLQIAEISEVCGVDDVQLIVDIVEGMIENKEIYAQYFSSTKSVAFDQQANIDEIDKLMSTYKDWEDEKVGKK
jgi:hypothetical protein